MLKLEIAQQSETGTAQCAICLLPCHLMPEMVAVRGGESDYVELADTPFVCLRCVYGAVERVIRELRNRAESSRRAAQQLDRWADEGIDLDGQLKEVIGSERSLAWLPGEKPPTI